jgi:hypothetical protein
MQYRTTATTQSAREASPESDVPSAVPKALMVQDRMLRKKITQMQGTFYKNYMSQM